ncbi:enoyl-[acyl carrier protein] reductase II, partial [Desmospora sp. 8437]
MTAVFWLHPVIPAEWGGPVIKYRCVKSGNLDLPRTDEISFPRQSGPLEQNRNQKEESRMWGENRLTRMLGIRYPVIQAGMAGGAAMPELVAAVSEAGGLGTLGAGYLSPEGIREAIREIRSRTDRPFAVNLLVTQEPSPSAEELQRGRELLAPVQREMGLEPGEPARYAPSFAAQMEVLVEEKIPVFSFTFAIPEQKWLNRLKDEGTILIGTATTVREGELLEAAGVDLVTAQGAEAGGHRGTFAGTYEQGMVGTMALVPQLVDGIGL